MKTIIIYHRVDWDGYTSAAVALKRFPQADLLGWNYGDVLPSVENYDRVVLVDLTISNNGDYSWMHENADKLIWIDHHMSAINAVNRPDINGLRRDDIGACVLTWEFFFPERLCPDHVALCGTYDVFRKDNFHAHWDSAWAYQLALGEYGPGWTKETGDRSLELVNLAVQFINEHDGHTWIRVLKGGQLEEERAQKERELFESAVYHTIRGVKYCMINAVGQPAMLIKNHLDAHTADVFILVNNETVVKSSDVFGDYYKVSVRVPENSSFDAAAFCRKFGGNGHIKAAGCIIPTVYLNLLQVGIEPNIGNTTIW